MGENKMEYKQKGIELKLVELNGMDRSEWTRIDNMEWKGIEIWNGREHRMSGMGVYKQENRKEWNTVEVNGTECIVEQNRKEWNLVKVKQNAKKQN